MVVLEEEEERLLSGGAAGMNSLGGNDVVGAPASDGKVHSDHHLDIETPVTAHQISHGYLSIFLFLQTVFL